MKFSYIFILLGLYVKLPNSFFTASVNNQILRLFNIKETIKRQNKIGFNKTSWDWLS